MVTGPLDIPVTTPVAETLPVDGLLLLHTPPGTGSDNVMADPTQTLSGPEMEPASVAGSTVI
jgi:hypothetical protein